MREPKDDLQRKATADVQNHGWHVLKVVEDSEGRFSEPEALSARGRARKSARSR